MSDRDNEIVICAAVRTPIGAFQGALSPVTAPELGAIAAREAIKRAGVNGDDVNEVFMGCVLPAGLKQAPARQVSLGAGLPESVPCTTINKMCGSGLKAIMLAYDSIKAGTNSVVLAGGIESMSNAPYIMPKAREGFRMGHHTVYDHMFLDGLEDAYSTGKLMGCFADDTAAEQKINRQSQDDFAIESLKRAQAAQENGWFDDEITPVTVTTRKGETIVSQDETPQTARLDKIPTLKPAFSKDGTVTAANASSISDGAAAVIVARRAQAEKLGLTILARIHGHASHARKPEHFCTAPIGAMQTLFAKTGWTPTEVDLYEINEAFAVVTMAAMKAFDLPHEKVNIHGGACALGHPVGATGARFMATLIYALKQNNLKKGVASLCIGGGEATAMAIEIEE